VFEGVFIFLILRPLSIGFFKAINVT
jgi:hypothetical protein